MRCCEICRAIRSMQKQISWISQCISCDEQTPVSTNDRINEKSTLMLFKCKLTLNNIIEMFMFILNGILIDEFLFRWNCCQHEDPNYVQFSQAVTINGSSMSWSYLIMANVWGYHNNGYEMNEYLNKCSLISNQK